MAVPKKKISRKKRDYKRLNKKIKLPILFKKDNKDYLKHHFNKIIFLPYQGINFFLK